MLPSPCRAPLTCHRALEQGIISLVVATSVTRSMVWIKTTLLRFAVPRVELKRLKGCVLHVLSVKTHVYLWIAKCPYPSTKTNRWRLVFAVGYDNYDNDDFICAHS